MAREAGCVIRRFRLHPTCTVQGLSLGCLSAPWRQRLCGPRSQFHVLEIHEPPLHQKWARLPVGIVMSAVRNDIENTATGTSDYEEDPAKRTRARVSRACARCRSRVTQLLPPRPVIVPFLILVLFLERQMRRPATTMPQLCGGRPDLPLPAHGQEERPP